MMPEVRVGATDNGDDMDGIVGFEVGLALCLVVGAIVVVIGASFCALSIGGIGIAILG